MSRGSATPYREGVINAKLSQAGKDTFRPVEVIFHANTPSTLHVVLPPLDSELDGRPSILRKSLVSRTSALFCDEWDLNDPGQFDPTFQL